MHPTVRKVLQTYELLEQILLYLPFHDRFVHQRVSKQWRDITLRSTALQEEMFLSPQGPPVKPIDTAYSLYAYRTRCIYPPEPLRTNPAADIIGLITQQGTRTRSPLATFGLSDQNLFLQFEIKGIPIYERSILHVDASWRKMLITQPAIAAINFEFIRRDPYGGSVTLYNPGGLTFGEVHDWSVQLAREYWELTGEDPELSFESLSFCLFHPWTDDQMEEAW